MFLGQIKSVLLRLVDMHFQLQDLLKEKEKSIGCFNSSASRS